jgi:UDP-N-acetylmuramoyl-tripeptide--D-alanyl-D-alanine ligase
MPGRHAVINAMMALTIAELLGVAPEDAIRGLGDTALAAMRGEFRRMGDLTVIVDCYNANPQSVRGSLEILEAQDVAARRVAVLGTMLELGDATSALHAQVLDDALGRDIDLVVATGAFSDAARNRVGQGASGRVRVMAADTWEDAYPELRDALHGDEVVLLKASRGVALERLLPRLEADFGGDHGPQGVQG